MISQPVLLNVNNRFYLVQITKNQGKITDLHGPYSCVSDTGSSAEEFVSGLISTATQALHNSEPITVEDLPENLRKVVEEALNDSKVSPDQE